MLFVYEDMDKRKEFKKQYSEYKFVGPSFFIRESDNLNDILVLLQTESFEYFIVDISNLIKDGNYYKVFTERFLLLLEDYVEEIHFCIKEIYLDEFMQCFPDFFEEKDIDKTYGKSEEAPEIKNKKIRIKDYKIPSKVHVYDKIKALGNYDKRRIMSISELIDKHEGVFIKYSIEDIEEKLIEREIEFIDISSIVQTIQLRDDMSFQVELLFLQITAIYSNDFCVKRDYLSILEEKFPYMFTEIVLLEDQLEKGKTEQKMVDVSGEELDVDKIRKTINDINSDLKGHDDFKKDFERNLLKYLFLNRMGDRKIFSIIICGESGVGKTEFAKIVSDKMFRDEELIKINFGNYSTDGVLNSLIGSPLGYIGSEEGAFLLGNK